MTVQEFNHQGTMLLAMGRFTEALPFFQAALQVFRRAQRSEGNEEDEDIAMILNCTVQAVPVHHDLSRAASAFSPSNGFMTPFDCAFDILPMTVPHDQAQRDEDIAPEVEMGLGINTRRPQQEPQQNNNNVVMMDESDVGLVLLYNMGAAYHALGLQRCKHNLLRKATAFYRMAAAILQEQQENEHESNNAYYNREEDGAAQLLQRHQEEEDDEDGDETQELQRSPSSVDVVHLALHLNAGHVASHFLQHDCAYAAQQRIAAFLQQPCSAWLPQPMWMFFYATTLRCAAVAGIGQKEEQGEGTLQKVESARTMLTMAPCA